MPLERHRRVANVWNWLPGFRVVAEYQSIQRAALALHVSPSSLSRTIKLLEREVGKALFTRGPAGVSLTSAGRELLAGTRDAMRRVDEELPGQLRRLVIGADGPLLPSFIARAVTGDRFGHVDLGEAPARDAAGLLLRGELDLAVLQQPVQARGLELVELGSCSWVIAGLGRGDGLVAVTGCEPIECTHRVSTLDGARALAAALGARLVLPRVLLPPALPVVAVLTRRWPVYAAWRREVVDGQAAHLAALAAALRLELSGDVGVDEVV